MQPGEPTATLPGYSRRTLPRSDLPAFNRQTRHRSTRTLMPEHGWQQPAERVTDVTEKQRAHVLIKVSWLTAAHRKDPDQPLVAQRHQGHGSNRLIPIRKQKLPLAFLELAAHRPFAVQQAAQTFCRQIRTHHMQSTLALLKRVIATEQENRGGIEPEVAADAVVNGGGHLRQVAGFDHLQQQPRSEEHTS